MLTVAFAGQTVSPVTQAIIVIGVGLVSTLLGFGIIPAGLDRKKAEAWRKRYAGNFRLGGPLVILAGLVLLARAIWF
ncbi:MAG: hypothetical protein R3D44_00485 [Hyphomicrobiaceae bacterium]